MQGKTITGLLAAALLAATGHAQTMYVDDDNCPGPGSGTPQDPYCSIQTAIENATELSHVVVAQGTYYEAIDFLGKNITVRSTEPWNPVVMANTVIDGTDNFHVVQCVSGEGAADLSGFTITGGNANGAGTDGCGGGLYATGSVTVTYCTFTGNSAAQGGAIYVGGNGYLFLQSCTISGNSTSNEGGGFYHGGTCRLDLRLCTVSENSASLGGGMYIASGTATAEGCSFCGNGPDHICGAVELCERIEMSEFCPIPVCPGDISGDGQVNVVDFLDLLAFWGPCP
ncbi:MAG: right-handed parallel beta-helix repeat-containing protein [Planctomycetota bacterium]|jgi:predicted outer membrane repeat protein